MSARLVSWLRHLAEKTGLAPRKFRVIQVVEMVDHPKRFALYAVGEGSPWLACLLCPCGCGDWIQLSLLERDHPSWKLWVGSDGFPTLSPSVWRTLGCKAHFFVTNGDVTWCPAESAPKSHVQNPIRSISSKVARWFRRSRV